MSVQNHSWREMFIGRRPSSRFKGVSLAERPAMFNASVFDTDEDCRIDRLFLHPTIPFGLR